MKKKITRIVSVASAAVVMFSQLGISRIYNIPDIDAADTMTAFEITENMKIGWNLGNTFDAYVKDDDGNFLKNLGVETETAWENPQTTREMLKTVKAKGFNTIRIPVTWFQHVDENNNYKIDGAWMARVKEVVNWSIDEGFYVILNMHHEEGWQNSGTLGSDYERIKPFVTSVWSQIAEEFKDFDQHLVFETMNEPRAVGAAYEWWAATAPQAECDTINKLNADIVNVIRSTESPYKDTRLIMLPSYCASSDPTFMRANKIPEGDPYLAASVHAYTPYNFTMNDEIKDHSQFTKQYESELKGCLNSVKEIFCDKNIPVVIGEFSSSNYGNTQARMDWAETYMETTKSYGIPCVLWDNNVEKNNGGESHGYLNRSNCSWYAESENVIDVMMKVLDDSSIKWGAANGPSGIEHDDISTGKQIYKGPIDLDASKNTEETGYKNSVGIDLKWDALDGKDVAVKYTGDSIAVAVSDSTWGNWTEVNAYDVDKEKGIAYFSMEQLGEAWDGNLSDVAHFSIRTTGLTTVDSAYTISAGEAPADNTKKFKLDLSSRDGDQMLLITFTGAAGSAIEGAVGYMGSSDWEQVEFKDKIGADGKFVLQIPLSNVENGIPAGITAAEAQIWWCDDEDATMSKYEIKGLGVPPVTTTETTPVQTTTTVTTTIIVPIVTTTAGTPSANKIGDANEDGEVTMADAAAILQFLGNSEVYKLTETGKANADVDGSDGITPSDALTIQKVMAELIKLADLPLKG